MLKGIILDTAPKIKIKNKLKESKVSIIEINRAIKDLDLKYKRLDEIDLYNIFNYILSKKREC